MPLQKRVDQLPAVTGVTGPDLLILSRVTGPTAGTRRVSVDQIGTYFQMAGVAGPTGATGPAGEPGPHAATHAAAGPDPVTIVASQVSDFTSAVISAAPPTTNASLLTDGTLPDARLSANIARTSDVPSAVAGQIISPSQVVAGATGGTAAAPAYLFDNAATAGFFAPAADTVAVSTAGVERLRVAPGGNVGIGAGITAPGSRLVVRSGGVTSATSALSVQNSNSSALLFVRSDGNVGIAKSNPSTALDVSGTVTATQANITGTVTATQASITNTLSAERLNIGNNNTAPPKFSSIIGGAQSEANLYGEVAHAAGGFSSAVGSAQHRIVVARGITISGEVTIDIGSATYARDGHSLSVGDTVKFSTTGTLPTGLDTTTTYYVISDGLTGSTFKLSKTLNGASFNLSGSQSGTHTITPSTSLTLNGALGVAFQQKMVMPQKTTWTFTIKLSAFNAQGNKGGSWWFTGGIRRGVTNIALLGLVPLVSVENDFTSSDVAITADSIANALEIRVRGLLGVSVRWVAVIDICQVSYEDVL